MKNRLLKFDRKRHLLYSRAAEKVIQTYLHEKYPTAADALWESVQHIYENYMQTMPYLGGKKNSQAQSVYDCAALFACCEAVPEPISLEELGKMNDDLFLPPMRSLGFIDLNRPLLMRLANAIFSALSKKIRRHERDWPGNYHMEVLPFDPKLGVRYRFTTCPIADFARRHGLESLMPAMCNPDFPMLKCLHADLIRVHTCANGPCCDYWIVGDRSGLSQKHPVIEDKAGYQRTESGSDDLNENS